MLNMLNSARGGIQRKSKTMQYRRVHLLTSSSVLSMREANNVASCIFYSNLFCNKDISYVRL